MKTKLLYVFLSLLLGASLATNFTVQANNGNSNGKGHCLGVPDEQKVESAPFEIPAPLGKIITQVAIKTGNNEGDEGCLGPYDQDGIYGEDANGPNECYQVRGIGIDTVEVEKIGENKLCQEISHIEVIWTDSPAPTAIATATATPTSTPTAAPTEEPRGGDGGDSDDNSEGEVLGASTESQEPGVLGLSDTSSAKPAYDLSFLGVIMLAIGINLTGKEVLGCKKQTSSKTKSF
jgi:hypothetical protein